ncbi:MAG TPA: MBL fold metallo-hydrolase [Caulobacteraceae bacterium]|jgi:ribonuclease Z|nr:MBL fold metallo-hydrolase [Caulobacteraceae bacterium]
MRVLRWSLVALAAVVLIGAGLWFGRGVLAELAMGRVYDRAMRDDALTSLPDGLHVGLCGSGSPMPDPTRAGPCTAIVAGRRLFVVDSGEGSVRTLSLMNLPPAHVEALFLTHFHSDHIADVGELMLQRWAGGAATAPLPVYGPTGVDQVVNGFDAAYALDRGYRIAHHGPTVVPPTGFGGVAHPFAIDARGPDVTLIDQPDLKVIAFPVDHGPVKPAVGYLFIYKGRRVVVSGDTAPTPWLEAEARGADVLVSEGLSPKLVAIQRRAALRNKRWNLAAILHDILSYHTTPEQAAAEAERAKVKMLLFTHVIPPLPIGALSGPWLGAAPKIFHGRIRIGRDGDFVSLPAGSSAISVSRRLIAFH